MNYITAYHMQGFVAELEKQGGVGDFLKSHLAGRYGRQLALGAGLGAVGGAVTGDEENWKGRALKGALLGGGVAGGRILATKAGREAARQGLSRFGERQLYSLTGKGYGGRNIDVSEARKLGILKTPNFEQISDKPGMLDRLTAKVTGKPAQSPFLREAKRHAAETEAFEKGFHNIPGVLHGALTRPGELLSSGWQRGGRMGKAFAIGGLGSAAYGMTKKPEEGGPGRLENALRSAGSTLGYMVAPGGMLASSIVAGMGSKAGGMAGKAGDVAGRLVSRGEAPAEQAHYPAEYAAQPTEWR